MNSTRFLFNQLLIGLLCLRATGGAAQAQTPWHPADGPLMTRWAKEVSPTNARPEYPRPQMTRTQWQNLNGLWDYGITAKDATAAPEAFEGKILVPFPWEAPLSGVAKPTMPDRRLWYQRTFTILSDWKGQRILLHFGAVNWDSTILVNGHQIGAHRGGYDSFSFEVTDQLKPDVNVLTVSAWNPIQQVDDQVRGKQKINDHGMMYTSSSGIWQTVWLEPVPASACIESLKITPDVDQSAVHVSSTTARTDAGAKLTATVYDGGKEVGSASGGASSELTIKINNPHLWSPDDPHLYSLQVTLAGQGKDRVDSYFGLRKISLGEDAQGKNTVLLNNQPLFQIGALEQGLWPDGIYTAPADDAIRFDLESAKKLGFNLLRKHAKVEPDRYYYWADKVGVLVWQDMPSVMTDREHPWTDAGKAQFDTEWRREIISLYNHPSIVVWTAFNEDWGGHDYSHVVGIARELDPTRLVNANTGRPSNGLGDFNDVHIYPGPGLAEQAPHQAAVSGEFGGTTMRVMGHVWSMKTVFGYGPIYTNADRLTDRYVHQLHRVYDLKTNNAMCAFVYTMLDDTEGEIDGLITSDREVFKADPKVIADANHGVFPAWNPDLVPTSMDDPQRWNYTTSNPADNWAMPGFDDSAWRSGPGGFGDLAFMNTRWKTADIWIRRTVTLPATLRERLDLKIIADDIAEVYVNGVLAGTAPTTSDYIRVPMNPAARATLHPGANVIAAHAHQTIGAQGIDVGIATAAAEPATAH
jgi:hypothetical protein